MKERELAGLNASGQITDAVLQRVAQLGHVTRLDLGGSNKVTDEGLLHLAGMPQLERLELGGWESQITDRGLEVLQHLPELRRLHLSWSQRITDAGMRHLRGSKRLEDVSLSGTPTGDGALAALAGSTELRYLQTGSRVTDAGLRLLHEMPVFKSWQGGEIRYSLMTYDAKPNQLQLDGPITDAGLSSLAGLDGLFGLRFFWHCPSITAAGLRGLTALPRLGVLGVGGELCDDEAMRHIAGIPGLRMLIAQGTVATDDGFVALSQSRTIEYLWGRECPNLTGRGFAAMARMPALRGLGVSCRRVDHSSLSALAQFPALDELMPMDVSDEGFVHVGKCQRLEHLVCMYCRDTGDAATAHIAGLPRLRTYYAGTTQITDRSLELLGRMSTLERLEFWQTAHVTDAGLPFLAALPRLREITLDGLPQVTRQGTSVFREGVRVKYSP
jgi:hypothetical protein